DGGQPTVIVEIPGASTSTTYWTESFTSTTTVTGDDGVATPVVELPPLTTTMYWTESYTSTTTVTPDDGGQPTVVIDLP
ncbi:hypothetical protein OXX69_013044, partial [Metschnikowia pulcherrima]